MTSIPRHHVLQTVHEQTQIGEARRVAARLASLAGMDDADAGRVSIVTTELAGNLVKHAKGGELLFRVIPAHGHAIPTDGHADGIEIISLDKGPGMDLSRALEDGYSTSGTPGTGLGAIRRQSQFYDVYSSPHHGTATVVRILHKSHEPRRGSSDVSAVSVPIKGENVCGDAWYAVEYGGRFIAMVVDGLGHGLEASQAAEEAIRVTSENVARRPCEIVDYVHSALKKTRGAAMSIFEVAYGSTSSRYSGVGNISAALWTLDKSPSMVSHNGTLGGVVRRCQEFEYAYSSSSTLIMHSDGINTQWDLRKYPGLAAKSPAVIAAVLFRDHRRGRDDATVLVAREGRR